MPSADEIRDAQRETWAGLAAVGRSGTRSSWVSWARSAAMIERLDIAEDHQHLDIARGTGEPGLSIARLSSTGRVVLTDLVAEMLDIAARRARRKGSPMSRRRYAAPMICRSTTPHSTACPCVLGTCSSRT